MEEKSMFVNESCSENMIVVVRKQTMQVEKDICLENMPKEN